MHNKLVTMIRRQSIVFSASDIQYEGVVITNHRSPCRCLILPGSGQAKSGNNTSLFQEQLADLLADRGISTAIFKKQPITPNVVPTESFEVEYLRPIKGLVAELRRYDYWRGPLYILGHSLGGHIATYVASHFDCIAGVILLNSHVRPLTTIALWQIRQMIPKYHDIVICAQDEIERCIFAESVVDLQNPTERYLKRASQFQIADFLENCDFPFLCINCDSDDQIPVDEQKQWKILFANYPVKVDFVEYNNLNHFCVAENTINSSVCNIIDSQLLEDLADWMFTSLML